MGRRLHLKKITNWEKIFYLRKCFLICIWATIEKEKYNTGFELLLAQPTIRKDIYENLTLNFDKIFNRAFSRFVSQRKKPSKESLNSARFSFHFPLPLFPFQKSPPSIHTRSTIIIARHLRSGSLSKHFAKDHSSLYTESVAVLSIVGPIRFLILNLPSN